jgi:hypothetical protein
VAGTQKAIGGRVKPLFIPLKTEFYNAFLSGLKTSELRLYGPRWNEKTCLPGRRVVLSKGYGKANRVGGVITQFLIRDANTFGNGYKDSVQRIYGTLDKPIAEIRIKLESI